MKTKKRLTWSVCSASVLALALGDALAQDLRNVREPVIPPSCTTLLAKLSAQGASLAEADESRPDTQRIQQAIDGCAQGQAVRLHADRGLNAFLSGPLQLRPGVTLLIDSRVTLFGSRNPRDYDVAPGSCGILDQKGRGCRALINGDHADDAAVMGDGTIDGRGWAKMQGAKISWWDLAQEAKTTRTYQSCPRLIVLTHSDNFTLYRVTLKNAGNFHVYYASGTGFTAWGVTIDTPKNARNTDGIDPASASNVTITRCFIHTGDDNVAIKAGSAGPATHMTIAHNHFYAGHGMSIGSETQGGASAIRVTDLSIEGADNGLRIKSNSERGGLVHDVVYEDVCIRDTKNPILMDTHYPFSGPARDKLPTFRDIVLRGVRVFGGGKITLEGYDAEHRLGITFDDVTLEAPTTKVVAAHAALTLGPGPVNFRPSGEDVTVVGTPATTSPNPCTGKFVPLPRT
jgi:polygalacturonase